jgi:conjugative relaxase-like TrwC/TraI family protein
MTEHLKNETLSPEQSKLAAYYSRGGEVGIMAEVAVSVAAGEVSFAEGLDYLLDEWEAKNPLPTRADGAVATDALMVWEQGRWVWQGPNPLEAWEERRHQAEQRLSDRLDVLVKRTEKGLGDAPIAVVRPDIHPLVLAGLGIEADGILSTAEINALLAGRHSKGELIAGKHYAAERRLPVNPKDGEIRYSTPIGSYDFCPTPSKSVSVAWALAEPIEQAMIYNAHIEAAREAVGYIANEVGKIRLGEGGMDGTEDGHVAWLEFTHHTSRRVQIKEGDITRDLGSGDPDLHTHFLVPNAVFSESGKVGSLDTAAIGGFIFEADALYHARLGQKLRDAGFEVELDQRTGSARMPIVPEEVCSQFSKRTHYGEALARKMAAAEGLDWDSLAPEQRATRAHNATQSYEQKQKGGKDDRADVADWRRQAKEVCGWEPGSLQLYGPSLAPLTPEQRHRQAYDIGVQRLGDNLEQNSVIKHWDLRVASLQGLIHTGIDDLADIRAVTRLMATEGVKQNGEQVGLVWGQEPGKRYVSITTTMHQSDELEFIRLAKAAHDNRGGAIPTGLLNQKMTASGLDFSDEHGRAQRAAIERVSTSRFGVIIGAAGMGKTSAIKPLAAAWREQGREVWGTSLASRQSDDLVEAGIEQSRLRALMPLLDGMKAGAIRLSRNSVLVVDEWGTLGGRQGLELLQQQARMGFAIVAVGDEKQCGSILAGPIVDLTRRAIGAENVPVILTTKRQKSEREREIVGLLREGRAAEALAMKREDGTAELAYGGRAAVIARTAKLYGERLSATGDAPGISVPTNQDAHDVSAAVRIERRKLGLVGADVWTAKATDGTREYDLALAPGDRVRLFESTGATYANGRGGPIGRNGTVLEVIDANSAGLTLKNGKGRVGTVDWDKLARGNRTLLAYGDCLTINSAQGSSKGEQISAFPDGSDRVTGQHAYSSLTRHFHVSHVVISEQAERIAVQKRRPLNDAREITTDDKWANVARSFSYQPEKDSAIALSGRVNGLRQGGIKLFQKTLLPAQPGHRVGSAASRGPEVTRSRKMGQAVTLTPIMSRVMEYARDMHHRLVGGLSPRDSHEPNVVRRAAQVVVSRAERDAARRNTPSRQREPEHRPEHGLER